MRLRQPVWQTRNSWLGLLDIVALAAWGSLLLKYWLTQRLYLLIHPNYLALAIAGGVLLLIVAGVKLGHWLKQPQISPPHTTLFPPGWSSAILLTAALLGFLITPQLFSSQTAIQRGVFESTTMTRSRPQAFNYAVDPQKRSIIDWVRTLNVYPEPDAYTGQKAKVQGFVVHSPDQPDNYLIISRFVITCCAADAYPVGLPVKLNGSRSAYKPDSWLEIQGEMITETLNNKRQLVIQAQEIQSIQPPQNPFAY